jgi:hypothetical protein
MNMKLHLPLSALIAFLAINCFFLFQKDVFAGNDYHGMCNASAAVALDKSRFVVGDDEDNILRIYDWNKKDTIQTIPLFSVFRGEISDGKKQEIDLEGAAKSGNTIFWIGSYSTNSEGKPRPARQRLFAVKITPATNGKFDVVRAGKIYTTLINDLEKDVRFSRYKFDKAKAIAPKAIGGLSIEGLAATPEGALLIGFRNPLAGGEVKNDSLVGGKALIIKLLNPFEVIAGKKAIFGDPVELNLGGYGIRSIEFRKNHQYLIVAGPYHENKGSKDHKREESFLYLYSEKPGNGIEIEKLQNKLDDFNVEAAFFFPGDDSNVQLLSDDGSICKEGDERFRSRSETIQEK